MEELSRSLDEVVRRERGRVVGTLVRLLGGLDPAEEAFQEAALAALARWPASGTPDNPAAWLTAVARNRARDAARHRRVAERQAPHLQEDEAVAPEAGEEGGDDALRLVFTCCHPALTLESQVALTLKVIAGLTTGEIARAFLSPEAMVAQRIVRAKRTIERERWPYRVPQRAELPGRLAAVLKVIHLVFNEGHTARQGPLMRLDLQQEAWRLSRELCDLLPEEPEAFGLLALIALSLARAAARTGERGALVLLADQDRSRWSRPMIEQGLVALERARRLGGRARYVLEAEIAACHATAPAWAATDWGRILRCYDELLALDGSPVVALNRAVAVCLVAGPAEALAAVAALERPLARYHLFHALRADFRRQLGEDARDDYRRALELATNEGERSFLRQRLEACG